MSFILWQCLKKKADIRGNISTRLVNACSTVYGMKHPGTEDKVPPPPPTFPDIWQISLRYLADIHTSFPQCFCMCPRYLADIQILFHFFMADQDPGLGIVQAAGFERALQAPEQGQRFPQAQR